MRSITFGDRVRYAFDNTLARGTVAMMGWLMFVSGALVLVVALVTWLAHSAPEDAEIDDGPVGFVQLAWLSAMHALDAGTLAGDKGSVAFLLTMSLATIGGIFVVSILIGLLTSGIEGKLDELRKGRSFVVETDHTLILGWSDKVFSIVSELVIANESRKKARIVILADRDKVEMEDAIRARVGDTKNTRVICRTGNPIDLVDLEIVNPNAARSVILLGPDEDDPDTQIIKMILALTNNPARRAEPYHIVAEIREARNAEVARMIAKDEVELVISETLISRITVQTCRQSGLSVVYTELLDYGGDEIYMAEEPALVGKTFEQALFAYEDSAVIGIAPPSGAPLLNPPMSTVLGPGDLVVVIAEDDSAIRLAKGSLAPVDEAAIRTARRADRRPEHTLVLGWNRRGALIVNELDRYVIAGSTVTVLAETGDPRGTIARECASLHNIETTVETGDTTDRATLDRLDIGRYDHIILLCYSEELDTQRADAKTLVTLLHLRHIAELSGRDFKIVSEMLDVKNRELATATRADDFIVSDRLVSLMMSQVSENKALSALFDDIFDPEGSEIYLKAAGQYVEPGRPVSFATVVASAARRGEVAIGYRIVADASDANRSYGVVINPKKSSVVTLAEGDRVIVVAED